MRHRIEPAMAEVMYCGASELTAGAYGDNTAISGACLDMREYASAKVVVAYRAALTADKTLSLAVEYQQVDTDATAFETAVSLKDKAVVATGAGIKTGVLEFDLDMTTKKRYFTVNVTPDLSHTSTDRAIVTTTIIGMGARTNPITNA